MAQDKPGSSITPFLEKYNYQVALYHFLKGDYLSSAEISEKLLKSSAEGKANVLLRLSDSRLMNKRPYPELSSETLHLETPDIIKLLDADYKVKEFSDIFAISKTLKAGGVKYIEGVSLISHNRLGEAKLALAQVPSDDPFHPYSVIALAQIEVMRQDFNSAEKLLRGIYQNVPRTGYLDEKIHLMVGQIMFEKGMYTEAIGEFLSVPYSSPLSREALLGQAWSLIKMKDYGNAIPPLKEIKAAPPFDRLEQDAQLLLAYCYLRLGLSKQAAEHYQYIEKSFSESERGLEKLIGSKEARAKYIHLLTGAKSAPEGKEETFYADILGSDPGVKALLKEYRIIEKLRQGFTLKEVKTIESENYIKNTSESLQEIARRMEGEIRRSKDILITIEKRREEKEKQRAKLMENLPYLTITERNIYNHWKTIFKQEPSEEIKKLVKTILQEWSERDSMECSDSPVICHVINFLSMEKSKENPDQVKEIVGVLDIEAKDIIAIKKGAKTGFEKDFAVIKEKIGAKVRKNNDSVIILQALREEYAKNAREAEGAAEKIRELLDETVRGKLVKRKYELAGQKADIVDMYNSIKNQEKPQRAAK